MRTGTELLLFSLSPSFLTRIISHRIKMFSWQGGWKLFINGLNNCILFELPDLLTNHFCSIGINATQNEWEKKNLPTSFYN